jgi:hypothetical protein
VGAVAADETSILVGDHRSEVDAHHAMGTTDDQNRVGLQLLLLRRGKGNLHAGYQTVMPDDPVENQKDRCKPKRYRIGTRAGILAKVPTGGRRGWQKRPAQFSNGRKGPRQRFSGNVVCRGTRAAMIRPLIGDEHRWFANKTQRGGRWRSSTTSISPRATFPRSAPKSACSSVMLIRFSEPGMKLLAYAASLFFSSI